MCTCTELFSLTDPSEVVLMVDGTNDQCSRGEDIDFELVGFSVYGQVMNLFCSTFEQHVVTKWFHTHT